MNGGMGIFLTALLLVAVIMGAGYLFKERDQMIQTHDQEIEALSQKLADATTLLEKEKARTNDLTKQLQEITEKLRQTEDQYKQELANHAVTVNEKVQLQTALADLQSQLVTLRQQLEETTTQLHKVQADRDAVLKQIENLNAQLQYFMKLTPTEKPQATNNASLTGWLGEDSNTVIILAFISGVASFGGIVVYARTIASPRQHKDQNLQKPREFQARPDQNVTITMSPSAYQLFKHFIQSEKK